MLSGLGKFDALALPAVPHPAAQAPIFGHPFSALQHGSPAMLQITKTNRPSGAKDLLVLLSDPARLRELGLERNDRQ